MTLDIAKTKRTTDLPKSIFDLDFNEKCVVVQYANDLPSNFWLFVKFYPNVHDMPSARLVNLTTGYERVIPRGEQHVWLVVKSELTIQNTFRRSPPPEERS